MFIVWNTGRAGTQRHIKGIDVATGAELWSHPTEVYRSNLSVAAPLLKDELQLSVTALGAVMSAFFLKRRQARG